MNNEERYTYLYTTAGTMLDLSTTQLIDEKVGTTTTGRTVRQVAVLNDSLTRQVNRYVENLESVYNEHDWKCEIQFGNVTPREESEVA